MTENKISFFKMSGSGNDFILVDNRHGVINEENLAAWIASICRRRHSVGADGCILIEKSDRADFKWRFFNADGGEAEMCGNGGRCVARLAYLKGIAPSSLSFETKVGVIRAQVKGKRVKLELPKPSQVRLDDSVAVDGRDLTVSFVTVGVPHAVVWTDDIDKAQVFRLGRALRYHERFAPAGTNVNFVQPMADGRFAVRTYERGVEDETLACGTGSVACALVAAQKGAAVSPVTLLTRGGESLNIYFEPVGLGFQNVFLEGDTRVVYEGALWEEAVER
jgi:diaminopimelate epimerase